MKTSLVLLYVSLLSLSLAEAAPLKKLEGKWRGQGQMRTHTPKEENSSCEAIEMAVTLVSATHLTLNATASCQGKSKMKSGVIPLDLRNVDGSTYDVYCLGFKVGVLSGVDQNAEGTLRLLLDVNQFGWKFKSQLFLDAKKVTLDFAGEVKSKNDHHSFSSKMSPVSIAR